MNEPIITQSKNYNPIIGPLEPVLRRKFHMESEFEVQNDGFQAPEGKTRKKINLEKIELIFLIMKTPFAGLMNFHDPWVGTDTHVYGEAVFAGEDLQKQAGRQKNKENPKVRKFPGFSYFR